MSFVNDSNPKAPTVTFGGYVIADTVEEVTLEPEYPFIQGFYGGATAPPVKAKAGFDQGLLTKALLVFVTFLLGAVTTLVIAGRRQPEVAAVEPSRSETFGQAAFDAEPTADTLPETFQQAVLASLEGDVTRSNGSDLITPTGAMSRIEPEALTMQEILLGLRPETTVGNLTKGEEQELVSRNKLKLLREGVLAGRFTVKTIKRNGRERLCLRLPHEAISQDEAADLIEQAAARGEIDLPDALSTSDGSYDADTLIFNLVQTSLANDGTAEGAQAALEMGRRAAEASLVKTKKVAGERIYVVVAGDSLAYISLQFYGRPSDFEKIFEANREVLKSPDRIHVGQRLIIPS